MRTPASLAVLAAVCGLTFAAAQAQAAPCRNAKGHFVACPAPAPAKTAERCRDAQGHFASCAAVGSAKNTASVAPPAAVAPRASTGTAANTSTVAPGKATARCRDGSMSYSQHRSGSCSRHGGVAAWL